MDQFDRENVHEGEHPPAPVVSAAEELRSTVERQLGQIVEAAESRAAEIENRALEKASQIEREADRRAVEALEASIERAQWTLTAIDAFEREVGETVGSLRHEVERLHAELRAAREQPAWSAPAVEEPTAIPSETEDVVNEPGVAADSDAVVVPEGALEPDIDGPEVQDASDPEAGGASPEAKEDVRQLLFSLAQRGTPRADAERFLARFEHADDYLPILDEVYTRSRPGSEPEPPQVPATSQHVAGLAPRRGLGRGSRNVKPTPGLELRTPRMTSERVHATACATPTPPSLSRRVCRCT